MGRKHIAKYLQKYYLFISVATSLGVLYACSSTKKVPEGEFLLTKNNFEYTDSKAHSDELPDYVSQKPNKKAFFLFPVGLWAYNLANPKYDTMLTEYMTYPSEIRDQKLRDSLFIKYGMPDEVGKNLFKDRFLHTIGKPPVILEQGKTESSADNIRKRLVYRGYWDARVKYEHQLDSAAKKAKVDYIITHKDPTYISEYYYDIPDLNVRELYEKEYHKSFVLSGDVLDQTKLEKEVQRINEQMRANGYYKFNNSNEEIYFTADTLDSRKQVPLVMDIKKDSLNTPYKKSTVGDIKVYVMEKLGDEPETVRDSLRGINFYKLDDQYKTNALWRPIILTSGEIYNQRNFDLSKRNIAAMNNFSLHYEEGLRQGSDSIIDVTYKLLPLPKYDLRIATDLSYSQLLNLGISPSVDLTSRNVFGGAENLTLGVSGVFGSVRNTKNLDKRSLAYEVSAQGNLTFPRLLLPFRYYKLIPKRYSPSSNINLGVSVQDNIGLGRINFNTGLNYFANVNDLITHRLSLFNTQLSLTRNKDKYYEFFPRDRDFRDEMFMTYSPALYQQFMNNEISSDEVSSMILADTNFQNSLSGAQLDLLNNFRQTLINKDRQTQDVLISSIVYNFIYNEIGKKDRVNPFYFNAKVETSGNILGLFDGGKKDEGVYVDNKQKTVFNIPVSQFVKFDFDIRKYFQFNDGKHTLALRQFIGLGIPYGNSKTMPFVRSYFNGGSNDIRAWRVFGGLGPADSQLDERVRSYVMDNMKLTTNVEYRVPFNEMFEGAAFVDAGNIWSFKDNGYGDEFKFNKFLSQMGVGAGLGLRMNISYITVRVDAAYKVHDPNKPLGERWVISKWQPLKPVLNVAFGYPF